MAIRRYKLSQDFLDQYKNVEPNWGYLDTAGNSLGEITFLRSYSRLKEDGSKETWAETCQRVIEGMFTIQREHCSRNRIPWDYRKAKNTSQEAYHRMFTFKWLPPGRGIANMGASFVIDDWDSTPLQNCFAGEEQFITDKGIKTFTETVGTNVTIMTKNGKWVEAPVKSYGKQELVKLTLNRYNQEKVIHTTAGHRWFALEQKRNPKYVELTTNQLKEGMKLESVYDVNDTTTEREDWKVVSVEPTDRFEEVYCLEVPETQSFVLSDNIHTGNCAFVSTKTDFSEAMHFLMLASMNGVGVGLDTLGADKYLVKERSEETALYEIPDTREGWAEALRMQIDSFLNGTEKLIFDYSKIRPAGTLIKRFGGTASGPGALQELLDWIEERLSSKTGKTLDLVDIADIANKIGVCVVSGSSRRSAEILLGPQTDEYLDLKNYGHTDENGEWVPGPGAERAEWSWMSNNSVFAEVGQSYKNIAKRTLMNGEPGYVWMDEARNFGRMKDRRDNKDWRAAGVNPCSEQMLESYECCTLVETFPTRHESIDDYKKTLKVAYLYAKTVTLLPTVFERSNAIMARNRRIGLSQSGITTYIEQNSIAEWRQLCNEGYKYINGYTSNDGTYVRGLDDIYSEWLCVRESIRTTTIKPSGTISLLSGDSPGIHWNPASGHYIRRVTMGDGELLDELREAGYNVEESVYSKGQYVVSFPIKSPFKRSENDVTIWEKVALAAEAQHWWSDNGVSVTVSFDPESEGQYIEHILSLYEGRLKTVSFLPMDKNVYQQMPYEEITVEQYEEAVSKLKPVNRDIIYKIEEEALGEKFCTTDKCLLPNMEELEAQIENFENNLESSTIN